MILKYNFLNQTFSEDLVQYEQAILDISAFNAAFLKVKKPSSMGITGEGGERADKCYGSISDNAKTWMQVIAPHCKIIPESILLYDMTFQQNIKIIKQALEMLIENPNKDEIRQTVYNSLNQMSKMMGQYKQDMMQLITQIKKYYENISKNITDLDTIMTQIVNTIAEDEKTKKELSEKISDTMIELWKDRERLRVDQQIMGNTWYIIGSIFAMGIPLLIIAIDYEKERAKVIAEEKALSLYKDQLNVTQASLFLLYGAKTGYNQLKNQAQKMNTQAQNVLSIWQMFSDTVEQFQNIILDKEKMAEKDQFVQVLKEIEQMSDSWNSLIEMAEPLSKVHYEIKISEDESAA